MVRACSPNLPKRLRLLLSLTLPVVLSHSAAQELVPAVWQERELFFTYRSSIAIYSCSTLESRVASILLALGARPDLRITLSNCNASPVPFDLPTTNSGGGTFASRAGYPYGRRTDHLQIVDIHVHLSMPVEMTPDVVTELKADKARRELISQATGNPIPRFDDPIPFAAERRVVTLSHDTVGLEAVECEFLDELVQSSFRSLALRVVRRGFVCDRDRVSRIRPSLDVEALVPTSVNPTSSRSAPATETEDADPGAPADPGGPPATERTPD